jgi:hypothetical protein
MEDNFIKKIELITLFSLMMIIAYSQHNLQKAICELSVISKDYNMRISTYKPKVLDFKGKNI